MSPWFIGNLFGFFKSQFPKTIFSSDNHKNWVTDVNNTSWHQQRNLGTALYRWKQMLQHTINFLMMKMKGKKKRKESRKCIIWFEWMFGKCGKLFWFVVVWFMAVWREWYWNKKNWKEKKKEVMLDFALHRRLSTCNWLRKRLEKEK